eukprot:s187_g3.t1
MPTRLGWPKLGLVPAILFAPLSHNGIPHRWDSGQNFNPEMFALPGSTKRSPMLMGCLTMNKPTRKPGWIRTAFRTARLSRHLSPGFGVTFIVPLGGFGLFCAPHQTQLVEASKDYMDWNVSVKDAVEEGNAALRRSLEKAAKVLTTNVDLLTKYYSMMVGDKVDLLRAELEDLIPVPEIKSFLLSTMGNIHTLLSENPLDAAGEDAATRAVNSFVSDVYAHFGNAPPVPSNHSRLAESALMLMDQAQSMYHIMKYTTERHGLGRLEALNKNLGIAAQAMQKLARRRNHELGVYNHSSTGSKRRQRVQLGSGWRMAMA